MNTYVKAVLYAYPLLKNVGEEYGEHIRNRALLSYRSNKSAEELALEIAGDILEKRKLLWLKQKVGEVLDSLSDVEKTLVGVRYFGRERKIKRPAFQTEKGKNSGLRVWSERKYFRVQCRLVDKLRCLFVGVGLTKEVFAREFESIELFSKLCKWVDGRKSEISRSERDWFKIG